MDSSYEIPQALPECPRVASVFRELHPRHPLRLLPVTQVHLSLLFVLPDAPSPVQLQRERVPDSAFCFYSFLPLPCYNRFWAFTLLFFPLDFLVYFRFFFFG